MDLDAYFHRINDSGPRSATRETLDRISLAHVLAIPFENLDVLLGRGVDLSDESVDRKLISARRGGYCFEQNTLLLRVLQELGFSVTPISARVRIQRAREFVPPRTHVFLRVELEGSSYLVDVGVGGLSLTSSLHLEAGVEQPTPHEPRRLMFEDGRWFHQARLGGEWCDVCEFTLEEMPSIDREVANWFTSTHPQSHFRNRLLAARALPDGGRLGLSGRELVTRARGEEPRLRILQTREELLEVLAMDFGLELDPTLRLQSPDLDW